MPPKKIVKGPAGRQASARGQTGQKKAEKTPHAEKTSHPVRTSRPAKAKAAAGRTKPKTAPAAEIPPKKTRTEAPDERELALRRELIRQRGMILGEAKKEIGRIISGENRQIVETALDDGDWSVVDLSEDISLKQLSTHRENLAKIDEALRKLDEGTYGICEECGEEIDLERLKVMPFAIYCKDDQEKREIMEAMERETGI
ncbi:MAG: TraR/DksA C4-type zinc finger protein [Nitrospiraceae bacterium]|nr:TraR/DksA C4-type zinc finger protein [Nitrospiraceae bacterium]